MLLYMLLASFGVSLLSLIGIFFFRKNADENSTNRFILPTAVGVFLGVVFFELIPETFEASHTGGPIALTVGFLGFYLLSHVLNTFHHHHNEPDDHCVKSGARMLLIGDAIHNIADGVVIASAFMLDPTIGILTTIGIALHEVPQEIAEYGVLIRSGYTRAKALSYNFLSALSVVIGTLVTYFFATSFESYVFVLTGIAAGNLLYIATTDLIPELRESHRDHFAKTFVATLIGLVTVACLVTITHEYFGEHEEDHVTVAE